MKTYIAEFLGTFALVFCGTGAIVINDVTNGIIGHSGIAITFGLIVAVVIYMFGSISDAHINPAVTLSLALGKQFDKKKVFPYVIAQLSGGFLASILMAFLFKHENLGATLPRSTEMQSFVIEFILTFLLMLVILFVSNKKDISHFTGFAVGATVLLEAMFAGPITGASMNPARSIAPAIVSGNITSLWVYIFATTFGAVLATFTWKYLFHEEKTVATN
ncbi:MIP/aquaporin family protein [Aureivirga sp. CE67]|uniref:MIP/aquaporin family protein n=1 Tax=Aureivirga sp. CE67 TaxID=1788983 RepID=UPI0018CAA1F0|nr:aquaporin [Aureivirga sp. CE67]